MTRVSVFLVTQYKITSMEKLETAMAVNNKNSKKTSSLTSLYEISSSYTSKLLLAKLQFVDQQSNNTIIQVWKTSQPTSNVRMKQCTKAFFNSAIYRIAALSCCPTIIAHEWVNLYPNKRENRGK